MKTGPNEVAQERKQADAANRLASFQRLLKSGQANLAAKQYDAAVANLSEAIKLSPGDATALAALKQAEQARAGTAPDPTAQKNVAAYQKLISDGRFALGGKRYDGTGIGSSDFIAVSYRAGNDTGLALCAQDGEGWKGIWAYAGSQKLGTEVWERQ